MLLQEATTRQQDTGSQTPNRSNIRTRLERLNRIEGVEVEAIEVEAVESSEPAQQVSGLAISFGKVLPELLSGNMTQTRRDWTDPYVAKFVGAYNENKLVRALDKDRRAKGKQVGLLRLTREPYWQTLADMSTEDLAAEGFPGMSKEEFINRFFEGEEEKEVWVLEFEFIPDKSNEPTQSEPTQSEPTQSEPTQSEPTQAKTKATEAEATQADAEPDDTLWSDLPEPGTQGAEEALAQALSQSDRAGLLAAIKTGAVLLRVRQMFASNGGEEDKPQGFVKWLKDRGLKKDWAYNRLAVAKAYERISQTRELNKKALSLFYQNSFGKFASMAEEFQDWLLAKIEDADFVQRFIPNAKIGIAALKKIENCWKVENSETIPAKLKERTSHPEEIQALAQISERVEQLPESAAERFQNFLKQENPDLKDIASSAKDASNFVEKASLLQCAAEIDAEKILGEALRIGAENPLSSATALAAEVENLLAKFWTKRQQLLTLCDRLYVDTGASTPETREFLKEIENRLGKDKCSITLGSEEKEREISVYFNPPEAKAEPADAKSLQVIAESIEKLHSDCSELPRAVNGATVKISADAKRYPGAIATVVDDRDQDRVTVSVGESSVEPVLPASELAPYKPRRQTISVEVIGQQLGQLRRAIDLATVGTSQKVQELSAQNHTLEQDLKDRSKRLVSLKNETASNKALKAANQKLSDDLKRARKQLADMSEAKQQHELALELLEQKENELLLARVSPDADLQAINQKLSSDLERVQEQLSEAEQQHQLALEQKQKELLLARKSALVSPDAEDKIKAYQEDWKNEKGILLQRLRDADWKIDELETTLQGDIAESAVGSVTKACEKLGLEPPIVEEPTLAATLETIRGCGEMIIDWAN